MYQGSDGALDLVPYGGLSGTWIDPDTGYFIHAGERYSPLEWPAVEARIKLEATRAAMAAAQNSDGMGLDPDSFFGLGGFLNQLTTPGLDKVIALGAGGLAAGYLAEAPLVESTAALPDTELLELAPAPELEPVFQAEPFAPEGELEVLEGAADAPLVDTVTLPPDAGIVDVELTAPELGAEDLAAIEDAAAGELTAPPFQGAPPPPPPLPELLAPELALPELGAADLGAISAAAGGGAVLGTLSLPTLSSAISAAKKLLAGGGASSTSSSASRAAITPTDLNVDPTTGDTWLRPDDTGTVSQTQFAMFATALLALSSVFFIK